MNDEHDDDTFTEEYPFTDEYSEEYRDFEKISSKNKPIILFVVIGAGFLVLILLSVIILFKIRHMPAKAQLLKLEDRLQKLEYKISQLEGLDKNLAHVGRSENRFDQMGLRMEQLESTVTKRIDLIKKELNDLNLKKGQVPPQQAQGAESTETTQKETKPKLHKVRSGETLYRISRRYGLSVDELRKYNKLDPNGAIYPGQELKLSPSESD